MASSITERSVGGPDPQDLAARAAGNAMVFIAAVGISWLAKGPLEQAHFNALTLAVLVMFGVVAGTVLALQSFSGALSLFVILACISPKTEQNVRMEDILVPGLIMALVGKWAAGWTPRLRSTLGVPMLFVFVTMAASTVAGGAMGMLESPLRAVFVIGKRVEYFVLFILAMNAVRRPEDVRSIVNALVIGATAAALVGFGHLREGGNADVARVQGLDNNYNTLSALLVIAIPVALASALRASSATSRTIMGGAALFMAAALLNSYSREGYFILVGALAALGLLRYRALLPVMLVVALIGVVVPNPFSDRFREAVGQVQTYETASAGGNSVTARVSAWEWRWDTHVRRYPVLGAGVGSLAFSVDNEYILRLAEGGVLGLGAFLVLLGAKWRLLRRSAQLALGSDAEPLTVGLQAAFVGLLLQGLAAATFSTIRNMEVFWVMMGVAVAAAALLQNGRTAAGGGALGRSPLDAHPA